MQPTPTSMGWSLAGAVLLGLLACSRQDSPSAALPAAESTGNSISGLLSADDSNRFGSSDHVIVSRVWISSDGQVVGFVFATPGCDLCENRSGMVALFPPPEISSDLVGCKRATVIRGPDTGDASVAAVHLLISEGDADESQIKD